MRVSYTTKRYVLYPLTPTLSRWERGISRNPKPPALAGGVFTKFNGIKMERAKTIEQYVYMVDEILDELFDLRASAEYDMESMGEAMNFLENLEAQVKMLRESMADGSYVFAEENLPFMELVKNTNDRLLPFKHLFMMVNATHTQGLDVEDD